jgi:hypothetical protein
MPPITDLTSYDSVATTKLTRLLAAKVDSGTTADGNGNLSLFYDTSGPGGAQQRLTSAITYSVLRLL